MRKPLFLILLSLVGSVAAQQPENAAPSDRDAKLERAQRLHNEAATMRDEDPYGGLMD